MPNLVMTIPENTQAVTRPVIFGIINQINKITKIKNDVRVFFPGELGKATQPGSGIDDKDRSALLASNNYIFINVKESPVMEEMSYLGRSRGEHAPIFNDSKLEFRITPIYTSTNVEIEFRYRTPSLTEANRWRDDILYRYSNHRDINLHEISYHYSLPEPIESLLKVIHSTREEKDGYGDSLLEYILSHGSNRITVVGDITNNENKLAIAETQMRIIGQFDFQGAPEKESLDKDNFSWNIGFTYKFTYDKPTACNIVYPIIVHNQLLPSEYIAFNNHSYNVDDYSKRFSHSLGALSMFEAQDQVSNIIDVDNTIRLPPEDDFVLESYLPGTQPFLMALCTVDESDLKYFLDLGELGDYAMDPDILTFIKESEYPYITRPYQSALFIDYLKNGKLFLDTIECTNEAKIYSKEMVSIRDVSRIKVSVVTDYKLIHRDAIDRLRKYPRAAAKILKCVREAFISNPGIDTLGNKRLITRRDLAPILDYLLGTDIRANVNQYDVNDITGHLDPYDLSIYENNIKRLKTIQISSVIIRV